MGFSNHEEAHAVAAGYWPLYRFNPELLKSGKNPLTIDYEQPDGSMPQFLSGEDRYAYLLEILPDEAKILRSELETDCDREYEILKKMEQK